MTAPDTAQAAVRSPGLLRRLVAVRWKLLRLLIALFCLFVLLEDAPDAAQRLLYAQLGDFDYVSEVQRLRVADRYDEALLVADAGLRELEGDALARLTAERRATLDERDDWLRRGGEFLRGAAIGTGDSLEALAGAVVADFFIVGDVRDLAIEGTHFALDGDANELILLLSAVGVATTIAPQIDVAAALLKAAVKAGRLSAAMIEALTKLCRRALDLGEWGPVRRLAASLGDLSKRLSPAGTLRLLKHVDDPKDVERLGEFVARHPDGAFALHVAGGDGARAVVRGDDVVQQSLIVASKKGERGVALWRGGRLRLLRPHPLVGLGKLLGKGHAEEGIRRLADRYLDPHLWWWIAGFAGWALLEARGTVRSFRSPSASR